MLEDELYNVIRQDEHGKKYIMKEKLSKQDAETIADEYNAKGHKQLYWTQSNNEKIDEV